MGAIQGGFWSAGALRKGAGALERQGKRGRSAGALVPIQGGGWSAEAKGAGALERRGKRGRSAGAESGALERSWKRGWSGGALGSSERRSAGVKRAGARSAGVKRGRSAER